MFTSYTEFVFYVANCVAVRFISGECQYFLLKLDAGTPLDEKKSFLPMMPTVLAP
jgi:hypothetical protein